MCGIVGIAMNHYRPYNDTELQQMRDAFTHMLNAARSRGSCATGVMLAKVPATSTNDKPVINIMRTPLPSTEFTQSEHYENFLSLVDDDTCCIIGHTRAATGGSASDNKNNHPHRTGNIAGVHNGVIRDAHIWAKYGDKMKPSTSCDTEAIFAMINLKLKDSHSMPSTLNKAMAEVQGSWSLAFLNLLKPHKVYLLKNDNAPMYLREWRGNKAYFFGSVDSWLERAGEHVNIGSGGLESRGVAPYTLNTIDCKATASIGARSGLTRDILTEVKYAGKDSKFLKDNDELQQVAVGL